jgi:hypothetical protein
VLIALNAAEGKQIDLGKTLICLLQCVKLKISFFKKLGSKRNPIDLKTLQLIKPFVNLAPEVSPISGMKQENEHNWLENTLAYYHFCTFCNKTCTTLAQNSTQLQGMREKNHHNCLENALAYYQFHNFFTNFITLAPELNQLQVIREKNQHNCLENTLAYYCLVKLY